MNRTPQSTFEVSAGRTARRAQLPRVDHSVRRLRRGQWHVGTTLGAYACEYGRTDFGL